MTLRAHIVHAVAAAARRCYNWGRDHSSPPVPGTSVRSPLGNRFKSVAGQVFVLQVAIVVLLAAGALLALVLQSRHDIDREARNRSVAVAETFAHQLGLQAH